MIHTKKYLHQQNQLSLWDLSPSSCETTIESINLEIENRKNSEFQLSFPVNSQNFSLSSIDFVKIVILDSHGLQDAVLFITQSQDGIFHLIFFEKMNPERNNPRRLEIILETNGINYQRVGNSQHWETDSELIYDVEEWESILQAASQQNLDPKDHFLVETLTKLLIHNFALSQ